nr:uncharacterized protein LOC114921226 isoform X5 [Labrus bergylta]
MKIFAYACCLLSALSAVQMKTVNIDKHVGENVTIRCSGWGVWTYVKENVKYFCPSPRMEKKNTLSSKQNLVGSNGLLQRHNNLQERVEQLIKTINPFSLLQWMNTKSQARSDQPTRIMFCSR